MSTAVRHEQPSWIIIYDRDEERVIHGSPGAWHEYSSVQSIDGLGAYVLKEQAKAIMVKDGASLHMLSAPEPAFFFSFGRSRTQFGVVTSDGNPEGMVETPIGTEWLFTVFGYLLPDYRVYLTVLPSHTEYHCEPRTTHFLVV